jgi:hypothetical protein
LLDPQPSKFPAGKEKAISAHVAALPFRFEPLSTGLADAATVSVGKTRSGAAIHESTPYRGTYVPHTPGVPPAPHD